MNRLNYYDKILNQWVPFNADDAQTLGGKSESDFASADEVQQTSANLESINSQLADIVTNVSQFGAKGDGISDDTTAIQNALNKKGYVRITKPGTYLVNRLVISSDTTFEISPGVKLKKKAGTNTNLLVNSAYLNQTTRDKNIKIIGGEWDANASENSPPSNLSLICVIFYKIDGLSIESIDKIGNEYKYCYLIADCTNITANDIVFDNTSDGLHFQPPIKNLYVNNITGHTGDDMVAFTMGDYNAYALGIDGDIENVFVENIYSDDTTKEHIKLVGDGINHTSKFRNMRFEKIRGGATVSSVCIMQRDQAVANNYLNNTYLENIVFSDIQPKLSGSIPTFLISATSGDITIENTTYKQQGSNRFIQIVTGNTGSLDKLTLRNVKSLDNTPGIALSSVLRVDSTMTIKQLNLIDCRMDLKNVTAGYFIYTTNNSILSMCIDNSYIDMGTVGDLLFSDGTSATTANVYINNSKINNSYMAFYTSTPLNIKVSNSSIAANFFMYFVDGGNIRLLTSSSSITATTLNNTLTASRILSLSSTDVGFPGLVSTLTPSSGDIIRSVQATEKGLHFYNGTAWVKFAS